MCTGGYAARGLDYFANYGLVTGTDKGNELIPGYGTGCLAYDFGGNALNHFSAVASNSQCAAGCTNSYEGQFLADIRGNEPKSRRHNIYEPDFDNKAKQFIP